MEPRAAIAYARRGAADRSEYRQAAGIIAGARSFLLPAELQAINPVVAFFRQQFQAAEHNRSGASSRILRWRLPKPALLIGISNTGPCTARAPDFPHSLSILFQPRKIWQRALISNICPCTARAADLLRSSSILFEPRNMQRARIAIVDTWMLAAALRPPHRTIGHWPLWLAALKAKRGQNIF
jgi:hypothetical protein